MSSRLQVSRKSWHYRLLRFLCDPIPDKGTPRAEPHVPKNLCRYFWNLVGRALALPLMAITLAGVAAVVIPIVLLAEWMEPKWQARQERKRIEKGLTPKLPNHPGLVRSYIRARKQKVCPLIEVVD